jgi:hypothetical protein
LVYILTCHMLFRPWQLRPGLYTTNVVHIFIF